MYKWRMCSLCHCEPKRGEAISHCFSRIIASFFIPSLRGAKRRSNLIILMRLPRALRALVMTHTFITAGETISCCSSLMRLPRLPCGSLAMTLLSRALVMTHTFIIASETISCCSSLMRLPRLPCDSLAMTLLFF